MGIRKNKPVGRKLRFKPIELESQVPSKQVRPDQIVGETEGASVQKITKATLEANEFEGFRAAQAKRTVAADVKLDGKPKVHATFDDIEGVDGATMRNNAGWEEYKQGNYAGAEALFAQALEQNPPPDVEKSIHNRLGATLLETPGRLGDAKQSLQKALAIDEEYAPANYNMACVSAKEGQPQLAAGYLQMAMATDRAFFTSLAEKSMASGDLAAVASDPLFLAEMAS